MSWVDVVDTAIKIGLGALVAGAFALISAKVSNRHQLTLSREERLRKTLEEISKELETTISLLFSRGIDDARYGENQLASGYNEEEWWKKFEEYQAAVDDAIATISVLDGKLRLYACDVSANKLTIISDLLLKLPDKIGPMETLENNQKFLDDVVRDAFKEINEMKAVFYKELNKEITKVIR